MIRHDSKHAVIATLFHGGLTPSQIAAQAPLSLSRIEVLSALHHQGLTARGPAVDTPLKVRKAPPPRPERPITLPKLIPGTYRPRADMAPPDPIRFTIDNLRANTCRWPIGDPKTPGFSFCGCVTEKHGSPYCNAHRLKAYISRGAPLER